MSSIVQEEKMQLRAEKQLHLKNIFHARAMYGTRAMQGQYHPLEFLSLVLDYADPIKIPHFFPFPSKCLTKERVKLELCGIINHSLQKKYLYIHLPWFEHSANLACSIFFHQLREAASKGPIGHTLLIQADNCAKETHNQTFLLLCALLVQKGIFKTIILSSLEPGHTHIDIDRDIFARLKKYLVYYKIESLQQFLNEYLYEVQKRTSNKLEPVLLTKVYNWKEFFTPYGRPISGHQKVHQFKFFIPEGESTVSMMCRNTADVGDWYGITPNDGFKLFDGIPTGIPALIQPEPIQEDDLHDIPHFYPFLSPCGKSWWQAYMANQNATWTSWNEEKFVDDLDEDNFWPEPAEAPEVVTAPASTPVGPLVHVHNHPIISTDQLSEDDYILIWREADNQSVHNYDLARIVSIDAKFVDVQLFQHHGTITNPPSFIPFEEDFELDAFQVIPISDVLGVVQVTKKRAIYKLDWKKMQNQFALY